jgi:hypothetical protein
MAVETKFTITAECDSDGCFKEVRHVIDGDWFSDNIDETETQDFVTQLQCDGWEVVRVSYEEIEVYCPECKRKRLRA